MGSNVEKDIWITSDLTNKSLKLSDGNMKMMLICLKIFFSLEQNGY